MLNDPALIDSIYEAAVLPDGWRDVINGISDRFHGKGGLLFTTSLDDVRWMGAGESEAIMADFIEQGWAARNDRVPRLVAKRYPGFVTDTDVCTPEEIAANPMYRDFLAPRGVFAGAATVIQGAAGDTLLFSIEGFGGYDAARQAIPHLDAIRPHLARAAMLSSQIHLERAKAATAAMQMIGAPAAFVSAGGRLRCANALFEGMLGDPVLDGPGGIRFADPQADSRFRALLQGAGKGAPVGLSIPIRPGPEQSAAVLHVLPVTGSARDVFLGGGYILVLTRAGVSKQPQADVLQALFDLTPAEARLCRALSSGEAPDGIAASFGIATSTIRSQLKSLFAKMGVNRQAQLVALLATLTLPG